MRKRIGVYGGTFSPPHKGHYNALLAFLKQEKPDTMLVIPTYQSPHKDVAHMVPAQRRLEMCKIAFRNLPVEVSDREICRGGKSYTVYTLEELYKEDTTLILLCGTDMFLSLDTWYQAEKIFRMAEIVYARRDTGSPNDETDRVLREKAQVYREKFQAVVRELSYEAIDISSSQIREGAYDQLDEEVSRYIALWNLYQN